MLQKFFYHCILYLIRAKEKMTLFAEKKIAPLRLKILCKALGCEIDLGENVRIAGGCKWHLGKNAAIKIGNNVTIQSNCSIAIFTNSSLKIDDGSYIGHGTDLMTRENISIGQKSLIAQNCIIIDCNHDWSRENGVRRKDFIVKPIEIGRKVWLGANVIVTAGSVIEDNCLIGAGAIVRGHIKKGSRSVL